LLRSRDAADLSAVEKWVRQDPSEKIIDGKPLWINPAFRRRCAPRWAKRFFALSQKATHIPDAPVASNGKGIFAVWSCNEAMIAAATI